MVINTNVSATNSARLLAQSSANLSTSLARLSSGSKLVNPQDDAAGTAVSMRFDAQINRVQAANNNVASAVSFTQTQAGFLQKVAGALNRMSELSILAQDVTKSNSDRGLYDKEIAIQTGVNRKRQINLYDPDGTRIEMMEANTIDGQPAPSSTAPAPRPNELSK